MRRLGLALLALTLSLGCRSKSAADAAVSTEWLEGRLPAESGAPTDGGVLRVRLMSEPACLNTLDDACRDGAGLRMTRGLVLESLLELGPDGALRPGLAGAWQEREEGRVTSLSLRPGATFSDGTAVSARDVVATFDALMDTARPTGALRGEVAELRAWRATDAGTVELTWQRPSPFAFRALTRVPIFSAAQLAGDWSALAQRPLGSGPFVVDAWERGQQLTLRRREPGRAHLERVVFRFVKDHTAAAAMFERGEFELMTAITPQLWRAMESQPWARRQWNRIKSLDNSYSYIAWNQAHPHLRDVRVRRALAHLYDAELITRVADLDLELPTVCPYLQGSPSCDPTVERLAFSQAAARALLTDAGFADDDGDGVLERDGVPLRFTFLLPGSSARLAKVVPLLQEQLTAAGIDLVVEKVETSTLSARVARRDFDAVSRLWTEFDTEQDLFPMFHASQVDGGANWVGYANVEVDRLIEEVRAEPSAERRHALQRRLHAALYADQPYLFMTSRQSLDAAKKTVHGLAPSVSWYDLRVVWVEH